MVSPWRRWWRLGFPSRALEGRLLAGDRPGGHGPAHSRYPQVIALFIRLVERKTGWWLGHPSEEYESQLGWLATQYMGKSNWCSKPPTSIGNHETMLFFHSIWRFPANPYPKCSMVLEYLPTFTQTMAQMWVNVPYMEHPGTMIS